MINKIFKYGVFFLLFYLIPCCLSSCSYEGQVYSEGESWNSSCDICSCHSNEIVCGKTACPSISCNIGEALVHPIDECCPQCIPYKKSCNVGPISYVHNDVWSSSSKCMLYLCEDGSVIPFIIQCSPIVCAKNEVPLTAPGECCPKCTATKCNEQNKYGMSESAPECFQNINVTKNCDLRRNLQQNLLWKNPCSVCIKDNDDSACYSRMCPGCTSNFTNNDPCCPCLPDTCAENCLKCLDNDTSSCTHCKNTSNVIHNGKCVKECPKNFYKDEHMHCKICPSTCETCFGNMSSQCFSCKSGYLLQKGHCIKTCDANFYESAGHCLECHESCSSCFGPSEDECIACALSGQLLQDGKCVDDCLGHFYISDGFCLPCNESCFRCLKNGSCQYCENGFYLQEGECLPECYPGYYLFLDAYCLPCHEECQECFGPLPYQCTSCHFNQFLLENSCVWDCGQGFFGDLGAGVCRPCHPECRACLGGSSNDKCLSCSSGYLLPYIGTLFGSCVQKCPDQYYLMDSGICGSCYETCDTCFGPDETQCLTCNSTLFFKNGACVPHCSTGYFEDGGICYACHPSCATCYGFTEDECYTCPSGRTLKFGKCIPICSEGKYKDVDGICVDCHTSCADCTLSSDENKTVHCIKCKNQHHNIYKDECILECSPNFYLNYYHICTECHPSCATCERTGATSCASCHEGNFLTHLGTCEHQCHPGYFSSGGICESCSMNCHECISAKKCLKCKGDLVLQFGECVSGCSEQYYLDTVTRTCKECSKDCSSCRGPSSDDCASCVSGKLFEDGVCVDSCSRGFFQDGNICKTCDLRCQTCSSLKTCTSCQLPYFLLKNECVDDCGAGFYSDFETQVCEACSSGCVTCISPDYCTLCSDGYYLIHFKCVAVCPSDYFSDSSWRVCKKNTNAPSLQAKNILKFQPQRKVLIPASFLSASDDDSDFLLITVSQLPSNGHLMRISETGEEIPLNAGENFTSTQLKDGWIFFKHLQGIPLSGDLSLKVTDGHLMGDEISLPLLVSSEFSPTLEQTRNIVLVEGSSLVLDTSYLAVTDPDNLDDVTLQVVESPCSAKLVLLPDEKEVQLVSYQDFLQNKLILKSSEAPLKHDEQFIIQVSDGFNVAVTPIKIFILPKNQKELFLLRNNPLLVKLNDFTKLTSDLLHAIGEDLSPNEIKFSIEKSSVKQYGNFFKFVNNSKEKQISLQDSSFSQEDINSELILYKYSANSTLNIRIPMKAMSTRTKSEVSFDFQIQILKYDASLLLESTNQFGMMVLQDHPATITNDHLKVELNDIPSSDIIYKITEGLAKEEGFLESLDKPGYRLQSFSQKDIDNMKIVYHPPPYPESFDMNYVFQFIVLDGRKRIQLSPAQNFTITVRSQLTEITSPSTSIDYEATILVSQGQTVELGSHWLSTVGHQMPDDQLEVVLNIAPQHGNLTQKLNDFEIKIEEDDGFSFTSIMHGTYYTHDGSGALKDFAIFKIMGGPFSSLNRINFVISPNDKESPIILDSTSLMGSVVEGSYLDLKRYHLAYTDLVSGDHDITFTLLDEPKYGELSKLVGGSYISLKISDTFTQQDINDMLIRYTANEGKGNHTVKDFLSFDVTDGSGNVQPNQVLTMKVKPKIRKPPVVKVITDVKVNEGGEAIIEPTVMTVFDPDSPLSDLVAFIEKQPDYGFLENSRPIPGAEKSLAGIPISSFSYIDLVEGYIKYIQITHRGMEPDKDTVFIRISDGYLSSPAHLINITIKPINDELPAVHTQHMSVLQGSFVKILNSSLSVSDADTPPDQLYIRLDNPPHRGDIKLLASNTYNLKDSKSLLKQDSFTFQDVLDGLIMYVHEDIKSQQNDSFTFTVSDGHHVISDSINISVIVKDRETPYLIRNLGLELLPGESSVINGKILSALDSDSPVEGLKYILTSEPTSGELFLKQNGKLEKLSAKDARRSYFTQNDIDDGKLFYSHYAGNPVGLHYFKFNINDPSNNTLLDQKFYISIFEDLFPPVITKNDGLEVLEKHFACMNLSTLVAVDEHQKYKDLVFSLTSLPVYGFLTMKDDRERPITSFYLSDLKAGDVCYVHKSERYALKDSFMFTVSDGKNHALHTFNINITHSYSTNLPFVKIYPLFVEEGSHKVISEFEIDIFDRDTADSELMISIISFPIHGELMNSSGVPINQFSFDDIKHGHVSYVHDNTDTTADNFTFTVTDGSNKEFFFEDNNGINVTSSNPVIFPIKIFPVDDSFPVLLKNEGLQALNKDSDKVWGIISENILYAEDNDTEKENILYQITLQPRFGFLELRSKPNEKIFQFTQKDIEKGKVRYILKNDDFATTEDKFMFSIEDSKPNKVFNNIFEIHWARLHFTVPTYNISETNGLLELAVKRTGNKLLDITASCKLENVGLHKVNKYIAAVVDEIHFKENDDIKFCIFRIINNDAFEGLKKFQVLLMSTVSLLASPHTAEIYVTDFEDEPTLSFKQNVFKINETDQYHTFPIIRQGDLSQELSVLCSTSDVTAQGSNASILQTGTDYRSRDSSHTNFIIFSPGISEMLCSVKIIDDNVYEEEEEFILELSMPHPVGSIKNNTKAHVIIEGPNDVPYVIIKEEKYKIFFGEKNSSVIIERQGVDMSRICTVWCGARVLFSHKNEEYLSSYYQITFQPFETSVECLVQTDSSHQKRVYEDGTVTIFIDSPNGCFVGEPNKITIPLLKKIINPVVEFALNNITVQESKGLVNIPVLRTGNTTSSTTLYCITQDGTAVARKDFDERRKTKNSLIQFKPGLKEAFCTLNIIDDDVYEGKEFFQVVLASVEAQNENITLGIKKCVTVDITDFEDITYIELEKPHYLVAQNTFPNSSTSVLLSVVRNGDTSLLSEVRISTIDGSALSGLDYYPKSKVLVFQPGERKKDFEVEILYNKRRNWALSFTVILGPDEVTNAEIGNRSKAVITIPRVQSTESLILPSVPIVVSLMNFANVKKGMTQDAKSGYPLICITPCDPNYPDYAVTSVLCKESGVNTSSLSYSWEISMPLDSEENLSPFEKITDSTLFTTAYGKVLDSIYFRPFERVRCIAQPVDSKGNLGIPLRSKSVRISSESGFCLTVNKMLYPTASLSSQPFVAMLNYINSSDPYHPNKLHIHIEIPHEDGLLPLLSTYPLHNVEFLLLQNIYRQQHVCSNLLLASPKSFLKNLHPQLKDIQAAFPYHAEQVPKEMQLIYQHLDLKKCKWSFDAWYSISDLVELCGGSVVSDFKAREADRTYISVLVPFYVTYVFAAAPTGWTSVEHRTELEFSFFYKSFLWKGGSHADETLNATLSVIRVGTDSSGHLFFEFKTIAKFYGCFVMEHHTLPGVKSHLTAPQGLDVKFSLQLLWSEQTFDGPIQFWKGTSNYNLKDYSGHYTAHLIPCDVSHSEQFAMYTGMQYLPCIAQAPQKFNIPITFQQPLRPAPITYALETFFQLFNDENLFLLNPFEKYTNFQYIEYKGPFKKGENVYGRVFWSPEQELESVYELKINEVLLCTGKNGFLPLYDPTGTIYGKGPQYGCLIPHKNLRYKFTVLDRHNPNAVNGAFQGSPFNAQFIMDSLHYKKLSQIPGVDGFVFNIDPLFQVSSSQQWFLQVTYSIKPSRMSRFRRSSEDLFNENRTNVKILFLKTEENNHIVLQSNRNASDQRGLLGAQAMYFVSVILIILGIFIIVYKNPKLTRATSTRIFSKYYMWMNFNTKPSNNENKNCYKTADSKQNVVPTRSSLVQVHKLDNKVADFIRKCTETEV